MKKVLYVFALALVFAGVVNSAEASVLPTPSNGSPEMVVNVWGTTNSQLPKIMQGQSRGNFTCPAWFPMYCVDISGTAYYQARWGSR